ncbi:UNVERIFIED_CONTAM: hypothetical protein FKN15_043302 [Acipenser sinensis]
MLISSLPKSTRMILKSFGTIFYGQMSQKWKFLADMGPVMSGENQTLHSTVRTSYQQSSMVVVVSWFGDALLHQDLDALPSLKEP